MKTTYITISVLLFLNSSFAADPLTPKPRPAEKGDLRPHLGVLLGVADPIGPPGVAFNYGVDMGIQPYIPFSTGLQFSRFSTGDSDVVTSEDVTRNALLAKGAYNFGSDIEVIRSTYIGFKLGAVWDEMRADTKTRFGIAPMVGFDEPVYDKITLGLEGAYLGVVGPNTPDSISLNGAIKYWF